MSCRTFSTSPIAAPLREDHAVREKHCKRRNGTKKPDNNEGEAFFEWLRRTLIGPGEMSLNASNTFSGTTTVQSGLLDVDNSAALGSTNGAPRTSASALPTAYSTFCIPATSRCWPSRAAPATVW